MYSAVQPRAWPNATVAQLKCARETTPFGELNESTIYAFGLSLFLAANFFLACFWIAAPWPFKRANIAPLLTPRRVVLMPITLLLALGANIVVWWLCQAIQCYSERMGNLVAYGIALGKWIGWVNWMFSFFCWAILMVSLVKIRKERRRIARSGFEPQRLHVVEATLPKPPKVRVAESKTQGDEALPSYAETA